MTSWKRLANSPDGDFTRQWNKLIQAVEQLQQMSASNPLEVVKLGNTIHLRCNLPVTKVKSVELTADLPKDEQEGESKELQWDDTNEQWEKSNDEVKQIANPFGGLYLEGTRINLGYHGQTDSWIPFGPPTFQIGKLTELLSSGAYAKVKIWQPLVSLADFEETEVEVTAMDWFLKGSESLSIGTKVGLSFHPQVGCWLVTSAECE